MNKRKDVQLFEFCHKKVDYLREDSLYTPLQVGASMNESIYELKDNTGDNIGELNPIFSELTGMYWIWKNRGDLKYVGQMTYRRMLQFKEDEDFDGIFKKYDCIAAKELSLGSSIIIDNYATCHNVIDLLIIIGIIKRFYPDYYIDCLRCFYSKKSLLWANGVIMKSKDYDKYCDFMFGVLNKYMEVVNIHSVDDVKLYIQRMIDNDIMPNNFKENRDVNYQTRLLGFLSERLTTLFLMHNFKESKILYKEYDIKEELG